MADPKSELNDRWVVTREGATADFTATLPPDPERMLEEIGARVEGVQGYTDVRVTEAIEMVQAADLRGKDLVRELRTRFLAGGTDTQSSDHVRIWEAVSHYSSQLASAYVALVRLFQTYAKGWVEAGDKLPMVIARAIRANSSRMNWQRMGYRPVDSDIWQTLSQLLSYAEDKGLLSAQVLVYEDKSTFQREFVKPLMLAMSAVDSLPPVEVDIAGSVIAYFAERFELQSYPTKSCYFLINVDRWTPAERYRLGEMVRLGSRFFGPGDAISELEKLSARLAEGAGSTHQIRLHEFADTETVVRVLAHLERHWSNTRPERREARHRALSEIAIVLGFSEIVKRIQGNDLSVKDEDEEIEIWTVENESDGGYGAVLPVERGEKLRVGELIAMRPSGSRVWGVGVIRRLAAHGAARHYVGIEMLARGIQAVQLTNAKSGEPMHTGLLLPSHVGDSAGKGEINLLLPADGFSPEFNVEMRAYGNRYLLEPQIALESGDDFAVARFGIRV